MTGTLDLFVVSNLGQARNVAAWRRAEPASTRVRAVVLGTRDTRSLSDTLVKYLGAHGVPTSAVRLPDRPADPRPWALQRTVAVFRTMLVDHPANRVWIANVDRHYSVLASVAIEHGASVCYYEEGLGTYRSADDPALTDAAGASMSMVGAIRAAARLHFGRVREGPLTFARRVKWNGRGFASATSSSIARHLARRGWYRRAVGHIGSGHSTHFFEPWTRFERASVAFPELLDHRLVVASTVTVLPIEPLPIDLVAARDVVAPAIDVDAVYVSQPYVDRGTVFYGAVAFVLARLDVEEVLVLPHPRERSWNVATMRTEFERCGIRARFDERTGTVPAEAILAAGRFTRCFGISSSTLLYGPRLLPRVEFVTIGGAVIERLNAVGAVVERTDRLVTDVQLLANALSTLERSDAAGGQPSAGTEK